MTNGLNKKGYIKYLLSIGLIIVISIASISYFTGQMEPNCPSKLILLGTGTPGLHIGNPRGGCSVALVIGEDVLVFDCGRWVTLRLAQAGIRPSQVTNLFFTHIFHFDHTCNYYDFLMTARSGKLNIYGPPGTKEFTEELIKVNQKYGEIRTNDILNWVTSHTTDVEQGTICSNICWKVIAANIDENTNWGPTIVYRVEFGNVSIVMAWDIHPRIDLHENRQPWEFDDTYTSRTALMELMEGADIVIADAMDIHTTPEGVGIAAEQAHVKKLILTHLADPGHIDLQTLKERVEAVFSGEVILGEDLMVVEI